MERTQVIIDDNKRAITIRTATGTFTQSGISKPIIDLFNNLKEENENLKDFNNKLQATKDRLDKYDRENQMRIDKAINKIDRIIDYGFDYDGFDNKEDLKKLIDMLVEYAKESKDILQGYDGFME